MPTWKPLLRRWGRYLPRREGDFSPPEQVLWHCRCTWDGNEFRVVVLVRPDAAVGVPRKVPYRELPDLLLRA